VRRSAGLIAAFVLASCAASPRAPGDVPEALADRTMLHPIVAWYDQYNEVLAGGVRYDPVLRLGFADLESKVNGARCVGPVRVVRLPPRAPDGAATCEGARGTLTLGCSDGRDLSATWLAEGGCTRAYGKGKDDLGAELRVSFGTSEQMAAMQLKDALSQQSAKPALPERQDLSFGTPTPARAGTSGTAFFVAPHGVLATSLHVVSGAAHLQVVVDEHETVDAEVIYEDGANDLALLQVKALRTPLPIRTSGGVAKGDEIFALGFPVPTLQGPETKATFGRVNALSGIAGDPRYLQMSAQIQPGNSGGPLFDRHGAVVGVVTATLDPKQTFGSAGYLPQNVNYAIKSDVLLRTLRKALGPEYEPREAPRGDAPPLSELVDRAEGSVVMVLAR
jgi:S1-C subfamily serine protease